jgi:NifU-like protein involved in Fe-S cluster formation
MSTLLEECGWSQPPLGFFEEFRELSERRRYALPELGTDFVEMSNPVCGDIVRIELQLVGGKVACYGYQQKGCWPVAGCLELLGDLVQGAPATSVLSLRLEQFLALVRGVPASKRHAFSLAHGALLRCAGAKVCRSEGRK